MAANAPRIAVPCRQRRANRWDLRLALMATAIGVGGLVPAAAFAQASASSGDALEEVVVTATRQTSTVNKVALSISAVTQKSLDQQGIRSVQDLSSQVPGFSFRTTGTDNNPQLTIRGIGGNAIGGTSGSAPTTGVYVDDVALQKRNTNGTQTGSGTPVPLMYDLERIEVLRGPQGTLYGGSSEGGTIRFITPQPSLSTYSGSLRAGTNTVFGGGVGNEEGIALGGPIVPDKLGFRVSGFRQDRAGWLNAYSEYDGHQFASQVNKGTDYSLHGAVLWQITPQFKALVTVHNQMTYDQDGPSIRTSSPAVNVPRRTFANCSYVGATTASLASAGKAGCGVTGVNGVSFSFPATTFGGYTIPAQTWLSNNNGSVSGLYLTATNVQYVPSPRRSIFTVPSLTLDYVWNDKIDFKSITAYTDDRTSGWTFGGGGSERTSVFANSTGQACPSGSGLVTPILTTPCITAAQYLQMDGTTGPANVFGYFMLDNRRGQTTQEFRVSTVDPAWKLQFVAGVFIEHENNHVNVGSNWTENYWATQLRGVTEAYFAGGALPAPLQQRPTGNLVDVSTRNIDILEDELSGFGEVNYNITEKLKFTAGVRVTSYQQIFSQQYGGSVAGAPTGFVGTSSTGQTVTMNGVTSPLETNLTTTAPFPTNYNACPNKPADGQNNAVKYAAAGCPYQYTYAVLKEHPITPKVGASYQLTPGDLLYATYSEGQRPGGVNPPVPPVNCAQDIANFGGATPLTYQHDTVKSTEIGGKFRLFGGRAQVNASAFHIQWDNVQFVVPLVFCTFSFVANAATASSDGGEIQATARFGGFTFNGNLGYDKAQYTADVLGPVGTGGVRGRLALKGDNLGVPDWTANAGLQYDAHLAAFPVYVRVDYAYTGKYSRATGLGTTSYSAATSPNFINGNETHIINARAGFYWNNLEVAGYVRNAGNSQEWLNKAEGSGSYFYTGTLVQPRIVGVQMNYRF
ncbi:MAG TPA: TonB-dependent receptor [Caulobacteraceae bacterium]